MTTPDSGRNAAAPKGSHAPGATASPDGAAASPAMGPSRGPVGFETPPVRTGDTLIAFLTSALPFTDLPRQLAGEVAAVCAPACIVWRAAAGEATGIAADGFTGKQTACHAADSVSPANAAGWAARQASAQGQHPEDGAGGWLLCVMEGEAEICCGGVVVETLFPRDAVVFNAVAEAVPQAMPHVGQHAGQHAGPEALPDTASEGCARSPEAPSACPDIPVLAARTDAVLLRLPVPVLVAAVRAAEDGGERGPEGGAFPPATHGQCLARTLRWLRSRAMRTGGLPVSSASSGYGASGVPGAQGVSGATGLGTPCGSVSLLHSVAGGVALRPVLYVPPGTTVRDAAGRLAAVAASACLVGAGGDARHVAGLVSERDMVRAVAEHGAEAARLPVDDIMTRALVTVRDDELLFEGLSRMVRHAVRRLVVLDAGGRVRGMLEERDLLAAGGENPLQLAADMDSAPSAEACRPLHRRIGQVMARYVEEGVPAGRVGRLGAELYDHLLARLARMSVAAMPLTPPAPFALAVLGSQARREQFLAADQDAALVISEASGDVPPEQVAAYFERLAARLTTALGEAGVPDCPHGVTPANSSWRMGLDQWRATVAALLRHPDADGVLRCSMLVDARGVDDAWDLVSRMRAALFELAGDASLMLRYMAREAVRFAPPLGMFGALAFDRAGPEQGTLDIKRGGVFPLMHGVRTLALGAGVREFDTAGRIAALRGLGVLSDARAADLQEALERLLSLRARAQVAALRAGAPPGNRLRVEGISVLEREELKQCFKVVADFQGMLGRRYSLHLMV